MTLSKDGVKKRFRNPFTGIHRAELDADLALV